MVAALTDFAGTHHSVFYPCAGGAAAAAHAAPGGKTTMLAQLMQGKGQVVALDRSHAKVDDIRALAEELGCASCIQAYKMDATKAVAKQRQGSANTQQQQQQQEEPQQQQNGQQQHSGQRQQQEQQHECGEQQQQQGQADEQLAQQQQLQQQEQQQRGKSVSNGQQPPPQQQRDQPPPLSTAGLSAKAQARLQRRVAAMAARGQAPPAAEYRCGM
jgi:hypothetical protein